MLSIRLAYEGEMGPVWLERELARLVGYYPARLEKVPSGVEDLFDCDLLFLPATLMDLPVPPDITVIYICSNLDQALALQKKAHADFLMEAPDKDMLRLYMARFMEGWERDHAGFLHVKWQRVLYRIPFSDILYVDKELRKVHVHLKDGKIVTSYCRMEDVANQLDDTFARIHFSCIVNRRHIRTIKGGFVLMKDGTRLQVSRSHTTSLPKLL